VGHVSGSGELEERLAGLLRSSPLLMRALHAARAVNPPDWLIGAGVIRDRVWDHLHGREHPPRAKDVDLAFFDASCLAAEGERGVQSAVTAHAPDICWEVTNQAAAHLWYPEVFGIEVEPLRSCADAVGTWPETATAVGVRLLADERIQVIAPCGLEDLFGLICRRNPRRVSREQYRRRIASKGIAGRWPRVRILEEPD
jgi:hypothetical protein